MGSLNPADIELKVYGDTTFQVLKEFVYVDRKNEVWPILPNQGTDTTDLASVPKWLWGLFASYGRQLAPALMHDYYCGIAKQAKLAAHGDKARIDEAYRQRRATDLRFREALRVRKMPWLRSNVFWAAVTFDRYKVFRRPLAGLYLVQALAMAAGVLGAAGLWFWHWAHSSGTSASSQAGLFSQPQHWLIVAGIALLISACYGWNSMVAVVSGVLIAPIAVIELAVTIFLAVLLWVPDFIITLFRKAFGGSSAKNVSWPSITPTRRKRDLGLR